MFGAAAGYPWAGAALGAGLLAVHLWLAQRRRDELTLVFVVVAMGIAIDVVQIHLETLRFTSGLLDPRWPPGWLVVLWAQFATTLNFSLRWLRDRWPRAMVFGALGGPIAFYAGARLGAVELTSPPWRSLGVLAVLWGAVMPLAARVAARDAQRPGSGRYRLAVRRTGTPPPRV